MYKAASPIPKRGKNETKKNKKRRNMNIMHGASIEPLSQRDVIKEIVVLVCVFL